MFSLLLRSSTYQAPGRCLAHLPAMRASGNIRKLRSSAGWLIKNDQRFWKMKIWWVYKAWNRKLGILWMIWIPYLCSGTPICFDTSVCWWRLSCTISPRSSRGCSCKASSWELCDLGIIIPNRFENTKHTLDLQPPPWNDVSHNI